MNYCSGSERDIKIEELINAINSSLCANYPHVDPLLYISSSASSGSMRIVDPLIDPREVMEIESVNEKRFKLHYEGRAAALSDVVFDNEPTPGLEERNIDELFE